MKDDYTYQFEKIYATESDSIFRFCLLRVSTRDVALDITQETFLRLWKSMSEKEEIHNPRAFLFTTTRRLIIDWYRKKKSVSLEGLMYSNEESTEYDLVDEKSIDSLSLGAEGRFLLDKIQELELTARQPVYLRFVEGLSPQEIGDILGVSANAASVRINRGLKELRKKTGYDNE